MFISSFHDQARDEVAVWEKSETGRRVKRSFESPYYFYVKSEAGEFTAITGEKLSKLEFSSKKEFDEACRSHPVRFESDLHPQEKVMMNYFGTKKPVLNVGFLDIEVDYDPAIGFPRPANPYAPISAITLYRTDIQVHFTLLLPPSTWGDQPLPDELQADNFFLFKTERELLEQFIDLIDDVDVLSGWNSEFFDLPYLGKRIELLFGKSALRHLAFEGGPLPRWGEKDRFKGAKEKEIILDLQSRVHLDYMALFKKFTLGGRQSYSLGAITAEELDVPKLQYSGTLYDLYRTNFVQFSNYNRHDVQCLVDLDKKFRYIELANAMVHEATVNFSAIFGSVQLIDTAIMNFCHHQLQRIVFDKKHKAGQRVEGALVMTPKVGLHKMIGSCDINSLYPSTYRSLNLSPEKIVGQLAEFEEGWRTVYQANLHPEAAHLQDKLVTLIPEGATDSSEYFSMPVSSMIEFLRENKYAISGYGTILDQSQGEGLLPAVLSYWFKGRRELQALKKKHAKLAREALDLAISIPKDLLILLE